MDEPVNALDYLEKLREKSGQQRQGFQKISRYLDFKARERGTPIHGQFELTPLCNFGCKMCYVHLTPEQMQGRKALSVDSWKKLMHEAWEVGMFQAMLTGGECLTYPGFDELFLYLHSLGCQVGILTNGMLLDEKRIQFFLEHTPFVIQITLYGWNDDVYERVTGQRAFTTVAENARKAIAAGLPVLMNVTPSTYLGKDALQTLRAAHEFGTGCQMNSGLFSPREETGRSGNHDDLETDLYVELYKLMDELNGQKVTEIDESRLPEPGGPSHVCEETGLPCGGGRSGFVVNWKGTMMPCNRMDMIRAYPLEEGFKAAWDKVHRKVSEWPRVPECEGCAYEGICNNCTANMLRFAGPGKQPKALCEMTKMFVRHGVRHIPECE